MNKKIDMCFPWIKKKGYSLTLASCFFFVENILHFKRLTVKSLYHKRYQKVRLLSSFTLQNTMVTLFRIISSVFSLCIESSIQ